MAAKPVGRGRGRAMLKALSLAESANSTSTSSKSPSSDAVSPQRLSVGIGRGRRKPSGSTSNEIREALEQLATPVPCGARVSETMLVDPFTERDECSVPGAHSAADAVKLSVTTTRNGHSGSSADTAPGPSSVTAGDGAHAVADSDLYAGSAADFDAFMTGVEAPAGDQWPTTSSLGADSNWEPTPPVSTVTTRPLSSKRNPSLASKPRAGVKVTKNDKDGAAKAQAAAKTTNDDRWAVEDGWRATSWGEDSGDQSSAKTKSVFGNPARQGSTRPRHNNNGSTPTKYGSSHTYQKSTVHSPLSTVHCPPAESTSSAGDPWTTSDEWGTPSMAEDSSGWGASDMPSNSLNTSKSSDSTSGSLQWGDDSFSTPSPTGKRKTHASSTSGRDIARSQTSGKSSGRPTACTAEVGGGELGAILMCQKLPTVSSKSAAVREFLLRGFSEFRYHIRSLFVLDGHAMMNFNSVAAASAALQYARANTPTYDRVRLLFRLETSPAKVQKVELNEHRKPECIVTPVSELKPFSAAAAAGDSSPSADGGLAGSSLSRSSSGSSSPQSSSSPSQHEASYETRNAEHHVATGGGGGNTTLWAGNIVYVPGHPNVHRAAQKLRELLAHVDGLEDVRMMKGYGFLNFSTAQAAAIALTELLRNPVQLKDGKFLSVRQKTTSSGWQAAATRPAVGHDVAVPVRTPSSSSASAPSTPVVDTPAVASVSSLPGSSSSSSSNATHTPSQSADSADDAATVVTAKKRRIPRLGTNSIYSPAPQSTENHGAGQRTGDDNNSVSHNVHLSDNGGRVVLQSSDDLQAGKGEAIQAALRESTHIWMGTLPPRKDPAELKALVEKAVGDIPGLLSIRVRGCMAFLTFVSADHMTAAFKQLSAKPPVVGGYKTKIEVGLESPRLHQTASVNSPSPTGPRPRLAIVRRPPTPAKKHTTLRLTVSSDSITQADVSLLLQSYDSSVVSIHRDGRGPPCRFLVEFDDALSAQYACEELNGQDIGGQRVQLELVPDSADRVTSQQARASGEGATLVKSASPVSNTFPLRRRQQTAAAHVETEMSMECFEFVKRHFAGLLGKHGHAGGIALRWTDGAASLTGLPRAVVLSLKESVFGAVQQRSTELSDSEWLRWSRSIGLSLECDSTFLLRLLQDMETQFVAEPPSGTSSTAVACKANTAAFSVEVCGLSAEVEACVLQLTDFVRTCYPVNRNEMTALAALRQEIFKLDQFEKIPFPGALRECQLLRAIPRPSPSKGDSETLLESLDRLMDSYSCKTVIVPSALWLSARSYVGKMSELISTRSVLVLCTPDPDRDASQACDHARSTPCSVQVCGLNSVAVAATAEHLEGGLDYREVANVNLGRSHLCSTERECSLQQLAQRHSIAFRVKEPIASSSSVLSVELCGYSAPALNEAVSDFKAMLSSAMRPCSEVVALDPLHHRYLIRTLHERPQDAVKEEIDELCDRFGVKTEFDAVAKAITVSGPGCNVRDVQSKLLENDVLFGRASTSELQIFCPPALVQFVETVILERTLAQKSVAAVVESCSASRSLQEIANGDVYSLLLDPATGSSAEEADVLRVKFLGRAGQLSSSIQMVKESVRQHQYCAFMTQHSPMPQVSGGSSVSVVEIVAPDGNSPAVVAVSASSRQDLDSSLANLAAPKQVESTTAMPTASSSRAAETSQTTLKAENSAGNSENPALDISLRTYNFTLSSLEERFILEHTREWLKDMKERYHVQEACVKPSTANESDRRTWVISEAEDAPPCTGLPRVLRACEALSAVTNGLHTISMEVHFPDALRDIVERRVMEAHLAVEACERVVCRLSLMPDDDVGKATAAQPFPVGRLCLSACSDDLDTARRAQRSAHHAVQSVPMVMQNVPRMMLAPLAERQHLFWRKFRVKLVRMQPSDDSSDFKVLVAAEDIHDLQTGSEALASLVNKVVGISSGSGQAHMPLAVAAAHPTSLPLSGSSISSTLTTPSTEGAAIAYDSEVNPAASSRITNAVPAGTGQLPFSTRSSSPVSITTASATSSISNAGSSPDCGYSSTQQHWPTSEGPLTALTGKIVLPGTDNGAASTCATAAAGNSSMAASCPGATSDVSESTQFDGATSTGHSAGSSFPANSSAPMSSGTAMPASPLAAQSATTSSTVTPPVAAGGGGAAAAAAPARAWSGAALPDCVRSPAARRPMKLVQLTKKKTSSSSTAHGAVSYASAALHGPK